MSQTIHFYNPHVPTVVIKGSINVATVKPYQIIIADSLSPGW